MDECNMYFYGEFPYEMPVNGGNNVGITSITSPTGHQAYHN